MTSSANLPISTSTQVFLDKNQNFQLDANEAVANVKPYVGSFRLEIPALSQEDLDSAFLVASSTPNSNQAYYLASPLAAFVKNNDQGGFTSQTAVISPLTSLIAGEMMANQLSVSEATENLSAITENVNTLENYTVSGNLTSKQIAQDIINQWKPIQSSEKNTNLLTSFTTNSNTTKASLISKTFEKEGSNLLSNNPIQSSITNTVTPVPGTSFVVVYKQGGSGSPNDLSSSNLTDMQVTGKQIAKKYGGEFKFSYSSALRGFSLAIPNTKITDFIEGMQRNPNVDYIEEDVLVHNDINQTPATWGLDRIDQLALPLNNIYSYTRNGTGVNAYVVDSGINPTHQEFLGRVKPGFTSIYDGKGTVDCKGHGSHVAGIIGGTTYGVAKNVNIIPVKVFDCNGSSSLSGILAGLDWIIQNGKLPGVINMSLGASPSNTFDQAVNNVIKAGFVLVVSAGNFAGNACDQSPARSPGAITVGSSDDNDTKSYYSNYGVCVDLFAPGSYIKSAWFRNDTDTNVISGTSMSAPHVTGVVAQYLQHNPTATPQQINYAIINSSRSSLVGSLGTGSPNRLLKIAVTPDFTPVNQPIYVPPITSPLPPAPPPPPISTKPTKPFRIISVNVLRSTSVKVSSTTWKTTVKVRLYASNNGPLDESLVNASFTAGGANLTCLTNTDGICFITSGILPMSRGQTRIIINGVTGETLGYLKRGNKISELIIPRP